VDLADGAEVQPTVVTQAQPAVIKDPPAHALALVRGVGDDAAQVLLKPQGVSGPGLRAEGHRLAFDDDRNVVDDEETVTFDELGVLSGLGLDVGSGDEVLQAQMRGTARQMRSDQFGGSIFEVLAAVLAVGVPGALIRS
jgi:hypothetical protein